MPPVKRVRSAAPEHAPLDESCDASIALRPRSELREGKRAARRGASAVLRSSGDVDEVGDAHDDSYVPSRLSKRILDAAREQLEGDDGDVDGVSERRVRFAGPTPFARGGVRGEDFGVRGGSSSAIGASRRSRGASTPPPIDVGNDDGGAGALSDEDSDDAAIEFEGVEDGTGDASFLRTGSEGYLEAAPDFDASGAEAAVLRRFMPDESSSRRTLADIIMEKLAASAAHGGVNGGGGDDSNAGNPDASAPLDPRIVDVYTEVGRFLASYKSGAVPKVLKAVPSLPNWEEVLFLTNPGTWTPHATYAATRIFVSNLNAAKAQRFAALVLLPKCRDDIFAHKRLNFHLYLALRKTTYKPAAFYKGILLPLAAGGDCTLREAVIFASVLARSPVPALHSAAALIKFAGGMPYSGAVSIFLRALINKKYALPLIAVDALAEHFLRFAGEPGPLPVIWHQAFLALAQRYRGDLQRTHVDALRALVSEHCHHAIGPEIRRELAAGPCRGEASVTDARAAPVSASFASASPPVAAGGHANKGARMDVEY